MLFLIRKTIKIFESKKKEIDTIGRVSYYKVDVSKSSIPPIGVDNYTQTSLKRELLYVWGFKYISYLGIKLTSQLYPFAADYKT